MAEDLASKSVSELSSSLVVHLDRFLPKVPNAQTFALSPMKATREFSEVMKVSINLHTRDLCCSANERDCTISGNKFLCV